jgi:hypothetical protein
VGGCNLGHEKLNSNVEHLESRLEGSHATEQGTHLGFKLKRFGAQGGNARTVTLNPKP